MERTFHQIERPDIADLHYYNRNISEKSSVTKHSNSVILQNSLQMIFFFQIKVYLKHQYSNSYTRKKNCIIKVADIYL